MFLLAERVFSFSGATGNQELDISFLKIFPREEKRGQSLESFTAVGLSEDNRPKGLGEGLSNIVGGVHENRELRGPSGK